MAESKEIILCESLIDALTFWCAGFRNVTAAYGVEGFTEDHRAAFRKHGTERVLIAYDRDEAGDRASEKLAAELSGMGIEVLRVLFPKNMDANSYALKVQPAAQSLGLVLRKAEWVAGTRRATPSVTAPAPAPAPAALTEPVPIAPAEPEAASEPTPAAAPPPQQTPPTLSEAEPEAAPASSMTASASSTYMMSPSSWRKSSRGVVICDTLPPFL